MEEPISKRRVVYEMAGTDGVQVRRDIEYADGLTMDLYAPRECGERMPAVVIVAGFPDGGFQKMAGCRFMDMQSTIDWARLIAASGMVAVLYTNREPAADLQALLDALPAHGVDATKIAVWASSGNVPLALSLLLQDGARRLHCAALCYGYMLDVEEAARTFHFANPAAGKTVDDLQRDIPLFVARAGQDQFPGLNASLDHFLAAAVASNLPISFVNHPDAPHAFDLLHDSEPSREIIRRILAFLRLHLVP